MRRQIMNLVIIAAVLAGAFLLATAALAVGVTLDELSWQTISFGDGTGAIVRFEATFVNHNEVPSDPVTGQFSPQPLGAFPGNEGGGIGVFEIPGLPPGESYIVINEVPLGDLPPTAKHILPWEGESGCPFDDFWSGGVEAAWTGDAGGLEAVHRGSLQVCPMLGCSYIRVVVDCRDGASWQFQDVCPGFNAELVDNDFEEAPNPLPPGRFEGWICVDANPDIGFGETCAFDLVFACGDRTAPVHMTVTTCDCAQATGVEPSTWGSIKQRLSR